MIVLYIASIIGSLTLPVNSTENNSFGLDHRIWSKCDANGSRTCGSDIGRAILCDDNSEFIKIQQCYCLYYDQMRNMSLLGTCMTTCFQRSQYSTLFRYSVSNATLFNDVMCSPSVDGIDLHREGRFCGRCQVDYGLAVYSYQYTNCIPCADYGLKNWLKYFAVSLLPLTLFYILVVTLRLSVTSSRLNGVLFILQCLMSPLQLRIYNGMLYAKRPVNKHDFSPALVVASY